MTTTTTTRPQREALARKWRQQCEGRTFLQFRRAVQPVPYLNGAICVRWCGMWLCIERDGCTHT